MRIVGVRRRQDRVGRPCICLREDMSAISTALANEFALETYTAIDRFGSYVAHREDTVTPFPLGQPTVRGLFAIFPPHATPAQPVDDIGATICSRISKGAALTSGMAMRKVMSLICVSEKQILVPPGQNLCVTSCLFSTATAVTPNAWKLPPRASKVNSQILIVAHYW